MNSIHSVDAMVLREMHRRCNYDSVMISEAKDIIDTNISDREAYSISTAPMEDETIARYQYLYERTGFCSMVVVPHINHTNVWMLSDEYIRAIQKMVDEVLLTNPFELVSIHDEYKCHPNHCNTMRKHYAYILAELAESSVLQDMLYQITGIENYVVRQENNLGELIRNSNYALC